MEILEVLPTEATAIVALIRESGYDAVGLLFTYYVKL